MQKVLDGYVRTSWLRVGDMGEDFVVGTKNMPFADDATVDSCITYLHKIRCCRTGAEVGGRVAYIQ